MQVRIITAKLKSSNKTRATRDETDKPSYKVIDWNNSSDRKWLTNHQHWAMNNQHVVLIRPIF